LSNSRTAERPLPLPDAIRGVRALVLDADGVLTMRGAALPGAAEALARLDERGIPYRVATNISALHRETLAARFARHGLAIPPARIVTALSASADLVRRAYPGRRVFVLTLADGLREFAGQPLLPPEEAASAGAHAAAVVLGDAGDGLSFANLNAAFRLLRHGADLIAMHRNGWWDTAAGETIDTGAFVAALEYATGVRAILAGKPAAPMYRTAFRGLAADVAAAGGRRLLRSEVAMIGDHAPQDVLGARRAGLRGVLVLSGRTTPDEVPSLRGLAVPDAVAGSVSEVVAALD
jgi:HAD superfamily hydrolase (TIGR01458 family)